MRVCVCVILNVQFKLYISSNVQFNKNYDFKKKLSFFLPYSARYAVLLRQIVRSSVRLSITLWYHDHIG